MTALYQNRKTLEKDATLSRQENVENYDRNISQEDTVWQNEVKEVIWLELQVRSYWSILTILTSDWSGLAGG